MLAPRSAAFLLAIVTALFTGCASKPTASLAGARVTGLALDHVDLAFDVKIDNPWVVPLPVAAARGSLASPLMNSQTPFLEVAGDTTASVPAGGSLTVPLKGRLNLLPLPTGLANVRPGDEIPYTANLQLALNRAGVGTMELPAITHDGKLPVPAVPEVSVKSISWPSLSFSRITGTVTLAMKNTNKFNIGPGTANGALVLKKQAFVSGDKQLSTLNASLPSAIGAGQTKDVEMSVSFNPRDLFDMATWAALATAFTDPSKFKATGTLDAQTPYAPVKMNFESR